MVSSNVSLPNATALDRRLPAAEEVPPDKAFASAAISFAKVNYKAISVHLTHPYSTMWAPSFCGTTTVSS